MTARMPSVRHLAPIAALALVAGAGAAATQAAGGGAAKPLAPLAAVAPAAAPSGVSAVPAPPDSGVPYAPILPGRPPVVVVQPSAPAAFPVKSCRPQDRTVARTPPSDALKSAFGILRRERTDADALPAKALAALRAQRLEPVDPQSARLLRADGAARAWVVPVPDVDAAGPLRCVRGGAAREGLAVVAVGGAPVGGGGALRDLQRGQAPATADPCAGADRSMLGVSGVVPDGVEAVFVTAADGTATRADVHDNGYAFVLPPPRRPEPRYLVWTGSDGAPHVQPLPIVFAAGRGGRCARIELPPRVTPDPWGSRCGPFPSWPVFAVPTRPHRTVPPRVKRPRRVPLRRPPVAPPRALMPARVILGRCQPLAVPPFVVPRPPGAVPAPAPAQPARPKPRPPRRP
jgi:hypothetical protein